MRGAVDTVEVVEDTAMEAAAASGRTYTTCAMTASATITMQNSSVFTMAKKRAMTG